MKITVFGSTGKAGQEVLHQVLYRGYTVIAYARNPSKIKFKLEQALKDEYLRKAPVISN
ncbi:MAG: NmrA family NAD(P)-binding protein [Bacillota bacterium]|nr:NmrA family NAD(P)-binding protein [Bacillota bacterium]